LIRMVCYASGEEPKHGGLKLQVDYGLDDEWHPHDEGPNTYKAGKGSKPSSSSTDPPEAKGSVREGCTTSAGNVPRLQEEWYRWAAEQLKSYESSPAQKDLTGSFLVGDTRYYPATSAYAPQSAPYGSRGPGATDCSCYARTMSLTAPAPISHPPIPSIHITRPDE
jgi:hypothetical protein